MSFIENILFSCKKTVGSKASDLRTDCTNKIKLYETK